MLENHKKLTKGEEVSVCVGVIRSVWPALPRVCIAWLICLPHSSSLVTGHARCSQCIRIPRHSTRQPCHRSVIKPEPVPGLLLSLWTRLGEARCRYVSAVGEGRLSTPTCSPHSTYLRTCAILYYSYYVIVWTIDGELLVGVALSTRHVLSRRRIGVSHVWVDIEMFCRALWN